MKCVRFTVSDYLYEQLRMVAERGGMRVSRFAQELVTRKAATSTAAERCNAPAAARCAIAAKKGAEKVQCTHGKGAR